jgi:hypothetical protein
MTTIQELATETRAHLWVLCYDAHGDMLLPDDYTYEFIVDALEALSACGDTDTARSEIYADAYREALPTTELIKWLSSHGDRVAYTDEAIARYQVADDLIPGPPLGVLEAIGVGLTIERREVFDFVLDSLEARIESLEAATP